MPWPMQAPVLSEGSGRLTWPLRLANQLQRACKAYVNFLLKGLASLISGIAFTVIVSCAPRIPGSDYAPLAVLLLYYENTFQDLCGPDISDFSIIQPSLASRVQAYVQSQVALGSFGTGTTRLFGPSVNGAGKWEGGAMAPNGKLYGARFGAIQFVEIDPGSLNVSLVGPTGSTGSGLVLLPTGRLLEIPHSNTAINPVILDPNTGTTSTLSGTNSSVMCAGGVLAPNGKVYCTGQASGASGALEIDPVAGTATVFGAAQLGTNYGGGAVLAFNGKIYATPFSGGVQMAEIDPETRTITQFGPTLTANGYFGGVLAPSGKIYVTGFNSTSILEVDPSTRSVNTYGNTGGGGNYLSAVLAPNGHVYLMPRNAGSVIDFDPATRTQTTFGSGWGTGVSAFDGGVLATNGKIYSFPLVGNGNNQQPLEIDPRAKGSFCPAVARSAYFNKF
ncbi:MAG: hypothetical protein K8S54_04075 [Spirochaetia bacterium]|nr:hypothetical protein [Spirochaetia bacterium]